MSEPPHCSRKPGAPTRNRFGLERVYIEIAQRDKVYELLNRFDLELVEEVRSKGCPRCGGPLHRANYPRQPRGGPPEADEYSLRYGLCCGRCRRRVLPPSTRFMGRKVYWGTIVLVVMYLRQSRSRSRSAGRLRALFGVSWQTVKRWKRYFSDVFPEAPWWRRLRDRVSPEVRNNGLPSNLLRSFESVNGHTEAGLVACLKFLAQGQQALTW